MSTFPRTVIEMEEIKLSAKGQVVIPKYLRDALSLSEGDSLFISKVENRLVLYKKPDDPIKSLVDAGKSIGMSNIRREIRHE